MKKSRAKNKFAVFILSHGRANRVRTYSSLRRSGYTGKVFIIVDDQDSQVAEYKQKYGNQVVVFSKSTYASRFDVGDNFRSLRGVVYARNAAFDIAEWLGVEYFLVLDDDYHHFEWRFDDVGNYSYLSIRSLDEVIEAMLKFYIETGVDCVAFAQGGDFIGGENTTNAESIMLWRKIMNTFFMSTRKRFDFLGRINEDTTAYVTHGNTGRIFLTTNLVSIEQLTTQQNASGLTDLYLDAGTYVKSFYSVMFKPSCVKISVMGDVYPRIHHSVSWKHAVPCLLHERHKKAK